MEIAKTGLKILLLPLTLVGKGAKWYGRQMKKSIEKGRSGELGQSKCPYCGSANNNLENALKAHWGNATRASTKLGAGLVFAPAAFFVGNKKKPEGVPTGECFDCGKKWRLGARNLVSQQP